jgi:hypothetical protein
MFIRRVYDFIFVRSTTISPSQAKFPAMLCVVRAAARGSEQAIGAREIQNLTTSLTSPQ